MTIAAAALSACGGADKQSSDAVGTATPVGGAGKQVADVTWAIGADPTSIDPAYCFEFNCLVIVPNVTESLLRLDPHGQPTPSLATSWKWVNPRKLVLQIEDGVRFHDGNPMTIDDVVYSLRRQIDKQAGSYVGYLFDSVTSIRSTGAHEVTIELSKPDSRLLPSLGSTAGAVVEQSFMARHGDKAGTPSVGMVGTGPYRFVSWDKGQQVRLERFDGYWNKQRPLKVERFTARVLPDEGTVVAGLGSGAVDGAFEAALSGTAVRRVAQGGKVNVNRVPGAGIAYLGFNNEKAPFDDARVRRALALTIDRQGLLESVWGGIGRPIKSVSPPSMWSYGEDVFQDAYDRYPDVTTDVARARELIDEAGAKGATAELWVDSAETWMANAALAIQQAGEQIGLKIAVKRIENAQFVAAQQNTGKGHPYGALVQYSVTDLMDPVGLLGFAFTGDSLYNNLSYRDARVDRLLKASGSVTDPEQRAEMVAEAERRIYDATAATVLYVPDSVMVTSKRIGGYELRPLWSWDSFIADLSGN